MKTSEQDRREPWDEEELPVDRKDMPAMMFSGLLVIGLPCFLIILLIVGVTILLFGR